MTALSIVPKRAKKQNNQQKTKSAIIEKMGTNSERGTIPDGIVGPHTDPVRDGPVLPHLLRQFLLDYECLV